MKSRRIISVLLTAVLLGMSLLALPIGVQAMTHDDASALYLTAANRLGGESALLNANVTTSLSPWRGDPNAINLVNRSFSTGDVFIMVYPPPPATISIGNLLTTFCGNGILFYDGIIDAAFGIGTVEQKLPPFALVANDIKGVDAYDGAWGLPYPKGVTAMDINADARIAGLPSVADMRGFLNELLDVGIQITISNIRVTVHDVSIHCAVEPDGNFISIERNVSYTVRLEGLNARLILPPPFGGSINLGNGQWLEIDGTVRTVFDIDNDYEHGEECVPGEWQRVDELSSKTKCVLCYEEMWDFDIIVPPPPPNILTWLINLFRAAFNWIQGIFGF